MATDIPALEQRLEEAYDAIFGAILDWRNNINEQTTAAMRQAISEHAWAVEALATERERAKCCANVCVHCAKGVPVTRWFPVGLNREGHPYHPNTEGSGSFSCNAWQVHLRAIRERGEAKEEKP